MQRRCELSAHTLRCAQRVTEHSSEDAHGQRVATLVVDDLVMVLLRCQESLLRHVALTPSSNLQCWCNFYVAIPVGFLPPTGKNYAFLSSWIVANLLQHR